MGEVALDVELPVAAEVSGRAVGEWPRSGHSGWTVAAVRTDGAVPRVVREVALGSRDWTLDGLAPGTYRIRAGADGTDRGAVVTLSAGERRDDVEVEIDHDGQVGGRVVDARGDAVGSVDVFVVRAGPAARGEDGVVARRRTDDSGRWNATLPAGEYTVHLHAAPRSCFTVAADEVAVSAGSTTTHEAVADDRGRIAGKVTWRTGMPYVGLSVRRADGSPAGRCSVWLPDVRMHDREFALTGLPEGTYRLDFVDPNGMALRAVARDGRSPQHFRMRDGADLADFDLRLERRAPRT